MAQRRKRILAVEDHDLLLEAIRGILEAEGYEVVTASDGVEALEKLQTFTPDLIVADISMPRMDGYTFYRRVRENPAWVPIPFVFSQLGPSERIVCAAKHLAQKIISPNHLILKS